MAQDPTHASPRRRHSRPRRHGPALAVATAVAIAAGAVPMVLHGGPAGGPGSMTAADDVKDAARDSAFPRSAASESSDPATAAATAALAATATSSPRPAPSAAPRLRPPARARAAAADAAKDLGGCPVAPADSIWRARVDGLPVSVRSTAYVASIGADKSLRADFGSGTWQGAPFGIPITSVPAGTPAVPVSFDYAGESDRGPYPVPADALVEGGPSATGDRHVIALDKAACKVYELYDAHPSGRGWRAGSGAVFDLRSNALRPAGWTSADAAGLPILPGLARYDEAATGTIDHALRITVPRTQHAYLWPARHQASSATDSNLPPMGLRLRLKAGTDISGLAPQAKAIAQALKTYGAIVADNGSAWYVSGTQDDRWNNEALHQLDPLSGRDFEAVDVSGLQRSSGSGAAAGR
ncbi:hypothetical protein [Streptomyces sp. NPDC002952]|uniref:hypothetical protein n=1 Tax=Streptomyces sp. NPDC002952 TaxID=3364673 RepID=UPI0036793168